MTDIWINGLYGLAVMLSLGLVTWVYSFYKTDVSIVDSLWSLLFLAGAVVYALLAENLNERSLLLLALIALWAVRLSVFLTIRNWGQEEDRRYREIRANNEPNFKFKSLYLVFGLQAGLAWIISLPLLFALSADIPFGVIELVATALWMIGFAFETTADQQLYRFKSNPANKGKVLNRGLWAYSRHPNYFGEFLIWWAYFMFAISAGAWWTVFAPVLMTLLLLKVSGVALMEKDISERRGEYREYIESTNAFIPGKPRNKTTLIEGGQSS